MNIHQLFDFINNIDAEKVAAIRQITIGTGDADLADDEQARYWQTLHLLPNLEALRTLDEDYVSEDLLITAHYEVFQAIRRFRGLNKLEVIVPDYGKPHDLSYEKGNVQALEREWRGAVAGPELFV